MNRFSAMKRTVQYISSELLAASNHRNPRSNARPPHRPAASVHDSAIATTAMMTHVAAKNRALARDAEVSTLGLSAKSRANVEFSNVEKIRSDRALDTDRSRKGVYIAVLRSSRSGASNLGGTGRLRRQTGCSRWGATARP